MEDGEQNQNPEETAEKGSRPVVSSILSKAMKERGALDRVSPDEFWTRMGFRQEGCAGNAVGVFVALFTRRPGRQETAEVEADATEEHSEKNPMSSQVFALPPPALHDLVRKHLMRDACDWSKEEGSRTLTKAWDEGVERAIKRKGGAGVAEEGDELGHDVVYTDVILSGPSQDELSKAEQRWKESQEGVGNGHPVPSTTAPVNTLSVKRKKKG
jgi:regulator of Ty1 transposition protein 109